MPLLLDEDYLELKERGISYDESEPHRFFIFTNIPLKEGLYTASHCDALVLIPQNYNQDGNDMFWVNPSLKRSDGKPIPQVFMPGAGDNRIFKGTEYCRWSRHWQNGPGVWRPGKDNIISIYRRVEWALKNPDGLEK